MNVKQLKELIEAKNFENLFYIFIWEDNDFLASQYCSAICNIKREQGFSIKFLYSLEEYPEERGLFSSSNFSYFCVFYTDKLNCSDASLLHKDNLIIVCKKVEDNLKQTFSNNIVVFPKIENWQLLDFAASCTGLDEKTITNLLELCDNNIYRLDQEIFKLKLFPEKQQPWLFNKLSSDGNFNDLTNYVIFDLINAIVTRNIKKTKQVLYDIDKIDIDAFGFMSLLYSAFKNIIKIQLGHNVTAESIGVSSKQFWAISKQCNSYSKDELLKIFGILTGLDKRIKSGEFPTSVLIDYIIVKVFGV